MPRVPTTSRDRSASRRHNPLAEDLSSDRFSRNKVTTPSSGKRKSRSFEDEHAGYIDASSSRKILAIAKDLAAEDNADGIERETTAPSTAAFAFESRIAVEAISYQDDISGHYSGEDEDDWMPEDDVPGDDVDPDDLAVYRKLLPTEDPVDSFPLSLSALSTNPPSESHPEKESDAEKSKDEQSINLADLILQRIAEKEARDAGKPALIPVSQGEVVSSASEIPPKVVEVFTKCGHLLARYKSGPLPKPFKILPTLPAWPELLSITRPDAWTTNAVFAATRIFISAPPDVAQHYLNMVLLDRVKEDIYETKKLNVHLYDALKKSLYKPAAFFKGFLFPLVMDGCTLREAKIISSVLVRVSIPVLHSAAALLRLCEIASEQSMNINAESAGACNIFIRVLLEKKYALPYKAVDALVFHFLRFRNVKPGDDAEADPTGKKGGSRTAGEHSKLPVLWHQSLLVFSQRYKHDITEDQREALLDLLLVRGHSEIGPEVRRELLAGRVRPGQEPGHDRGGGGPDHNAPIAGDGDDTMNDMVS